MSIKVTKGDHVRINCPAPRKYPNFHRSFHGAIGTVVNVSSAFVVVDMNGYNVNVDPTWLSHARQA